MVGTSEWYRIRETEPETDECQMEPKNTCRKKKGKGDKRYIEAVFYVPHTLEGKLKSKLSEMEAQLGFKTRVKYEEELGKSIASVLVGKDPFPQDCGR